VTVGLLAGFVDEIVEVLARGSDRRFLGRELAWRSDPQGVGVLGVLEAVGQVGAEGALGRPDFLLERKPSAAAVLGGLGDVDRAEAIALAGRVEVVELDRGEL
jgi:hypothetical protein